MIIESFLSFEGGSLPLFTLPILVAVGVLAGFVDTLAGGGGMITFPTFLIVGLPPDAALATNKFQGSFGTITASRYFLKRGNLSLQEQLPTICSCAFGAALGTMTVQFLPSQWLAQIIPVLLLIVAGLFVIMPTLGEIDSEARQNKTLFLLSAAFPIAFYDGFLGPGTGSFFLLALIFLRGRGLQKATIEAKLYNATTNVVSLFIFLLSGNIVWLAGLAMATGQIIGANVASGMILTRGHKLIRPMVIITSVAMSFYLLARQYWL